MLEKEAMGKRKVEIKRIEDKAIRQVTFCKRRNGLMEKARQLSILCDSSVAVFTVSSTGKLYTFSSGDSMAKILSHHEIKNADDHRTLDLAQNKTQTYLSNNELLEIIQCKLEETKVDNVSVESLISMEEKLVNALSITRAKKTKLMMEFVKTLQDKEKLLKEENQVLANQMGELKKLLEREDERAMSPAYSSGNDTPETLPLLK